MFGTSTSHAPTAAVEAFSAGLAPCARNVGLVRGPGLPPRVWRGEVYHAGDAGRRNSGEEVVIVPPGEPLLIDAGLTPAEASVLETAREWRVVHLPFADPDEHGEDVYSGSPRVEIVTILQARELCPAASEWLYDTGSDLLQRLVAGVVPADGRPVDERHAQDAHRDIEGLLGQLREAFPPEEFAARPVARRLSKILINGAPTGTLRDGRWEDLVAVPVPTRRQDRKRRLRMSRRLTVADVAPDSPRVDDARSSFEAELAADPEFASLFSEDEDIPALGSLAAALAHQPDSPADLR